MTLHPIQPSDSGLNLAPEVGAAVQRAENALLQAESDARRAQDPSAELFLTLRVTVGAMHKLTVDGALAMQAALAAIEQVKAPITADDIRRVNRAEAEAAAIGQWQAISRLVDRKYWQHVSLVGVAAAVALVIGVAGAWAWYTSPTLKCESATNGGIYCGYWAAHPAQPK
jgi:hypothetical protein